MQPFVIKKTEFITSAGAGSAYPAPIQSEIAIVGRSNVGKSSLINHLCGHKKLARTSQTPGKTRVINFYLVNESFFLVDLPGYGFAKASKSEQAQWGSLMEKYLSDGRVSHIFLLLDIRHEPTAEDRQMYKWIVYYGVPFTLIATKADKIAKTKRKHAANMVAKQLGAAPYAIPYSVETGDGKDALLEAVGRIVQPEIIQQEEANADFCPV